MNTELYLKFIAKTLETDGIKVADYNGLIN